MRRVRKRDEHRGLEDPEARGDMGQDGSDDCAREKRGECEEANSGICRKQYPQRGCGNRHIKKPKPDLNEHGACAGKADLRDSPANGTVALTGPQHKSGKQREQSRTRDDVDRGGKAIQRGYRVCFKQETRANGKHQAQPKGQAGDGREFADFGKRQTRRTIHAPTHSICGHDRKA